MEEQVVEESSETLDDPFIAGLKGSKLHVRPKESTEEAWAAYCLEHGLEPLTRGRVEELVRRDHILRTIQQVSARGRFVPKTPEEKAVEAKRIAKGRKRAEAAKKARRKSR